MAISETVRYNGKSALDLGIFGSALFRFGTLIKTSFGTVEDIFAYTPLREDALTEPQLASQTLSELRVRFSVSWNILSSPLALSLHLSRVHSTSKQTCLQR